MIGEKKKIPASKEQEIKEAAGIYEVVSSFYTLKRQGQEWVTYSPINSEERTPSFFVNPAKNIYSDFSAGLLGGDPVSFLKDIQGYSYPEALAWLADFYQIDLEESEKPNRGYFREKRKPKPQPARKAKPEPATIPDQIASKSFLPGQPFSKRLENNTFLQFLADQFGTDTAQRLADYYLIGTTRKFGGSPVFWQVDEKGRFRYGNVIGYQANGKRVKGRATAFHAIPGTGLNADFQNNYQRCLFGSHLIPDSPGPFAIVESEKTAVIASLYMPGFTWLATAGQHNIKPELLEPLEGKPIVLIPDLDATKEWQAKAEELATRFNIRCSTYLHENAHPEEIGSKLDIADFLLRFPVPEPEPEPEPDPEIGEAVWAMTCKNPKLQALIDKLGLKPDQPKEAKDYSNYRRSSDGYLEPLTEPDRHTEFERMASINPKLSDLSEKLGLSIDSSH